jgi:tetratricopeptide (TPR) repeat protein
MGSDINKKTPYSVMLSSTYKELEKHREAVREAMLGQRLMPIAMEDDSALPDQDLIDASLAKVEESDAYVGLISYRYGQVTIDPIRNPEQLSLTELEFRCAVARKIPICMFIMHDEHEVPRRAVGAERGVEQKFEAFVQLAKKDRIYAEFKSVDDLKAKAVQSLVKLREVLERSAAPTKENEGRAPRRALTNIPINVPRHFLGREEDLAAIDAALKSKNGRAAITALHGLRGVGKTTLAAAYAERRRADYRATWWIRAETIPTMRADLVGLGVRLGWVTADATEESALIVVGERLCHEGDGILLVYDNANNADEIGPYIPHGRAVHIIATSNAPNWRSIAEPVEIEVWPKEVGAEYLVERTGHDNERDAGLALSEVLGGLPLAHEQAAAYCERLRISLADYAKRFAATPGKFLDDVRAAPAQYHNGLTVAKTFALAIDEAAKLHPAAEPLIVYAALLAPEPIPLYLFSEGREKFGEPLVSALADDGLEEAVAALLAFALLDRETVPDERDPSIVTNCVRLHRLVRQVAAGRFDLGTRENARRDLIEVLSAAYPSTVHNDPKSWPRARRLDSLAMALVDRDDNLPLGSERSAGSLLSKLDSYRDGALAAYAEAQKLSERALAIRETSSGPDHPDTALSLNNLGYLLQVQGDTPGARPYHERALAIREKVLGPDHPDTATSLNNLGGLLDSQGDLAGARPYYERALAIREKALGPDHTDTANSLNNLGSLLQAQGDLAGARSYVERALAIYEKALGPDHPDTALSLNNLGGLLRVQGDFAGARPYYERALALFDKVLGAAHPTTKTVASNTARVLEALKYRKEAKALRKKFGIKG